MNEGHQLLMQLIQGHQVPIILREMREHMKVKTKASVSSIIVQILHITHEAQDYSTIYKCVFNLRYFQR